MYFSHTIIYHIRYVCGCFVDHQALCTHVLIKVVRNKHRNDFNLQYAGTLRDKESFQVYKAFLVNVFLQGFNSNSILA